jgi:hypothetical protein
LSLAVSFRIIPQIHNTTHQFFFNSSRGFFYNGHG